jgi:uncharacterized protein (DUF983 family)
MAPHDSFDPALAADNRAGVLLRAALGLRCAVCKRGRVHPTRMKYVERCPTCGVAFCREQGFFLGSIYFNYGLTVVVVLAAWFGSGAAFRPATVSSLAPLVVFSVLFPLWFLRYARTLFAAFDQYFDPRPAPAAPPAPDAPARRE